MSDTRSENSKYWLDCFVNVFNSTRNWICVNANSWILKSFYVESSFEFVLMRNQKSLIRCAKANIVLKQILIKYAFRCGFIWSMVKFAIICKERLANYRSESINSMTIYSCYTNNFYNMVNNFILRVFSHILHIFIKK